MIGQAAADRTKCWVIRRLQHEPRTVFWREILLLKDAF
ncbi:hypothetical protein T4A_178, partial [Trichinella pseudospiralis]